MAYLITIRLCRFTLTANPSCGLTIPEHRSAETEKNTSSKSGPRTPRLACFFLIRPVFLDAGPMADHAEHI
ncbi:hypothetical protein HYQ46_012230 [Verticillium longisporum]|nr:hypothetical protein HYQ44_000212 [Verticillium longisporum]KAG7151945.1 hypothetical protein HYQ46_012230 [Verticillium longisporum]